MASKGNARDSAHHDDNDLAAGSGAIADLTRQQMANTASTAGAMATAPSATIPASIIDLNIGTSTVWTTFPMKKIRHPC